MTLTPSQSQHTAVDFSQETWWLSLIKAVFIIVFLIANVLLALWVERRGSPYADVPARTWWVPGLFQAFADAGKLLFTRTCDLQAEVPTSWLPAIAAFAAFSVYAVIRWPNVDLSPPLQLADMPVAPPGHPGDCPLGLYGIVLWLVGPLSDPAPVWCGSFSAQVVSTNWPWACPRERVPHAGHRPRRRSSRLRTVLVGIHPSRHSSSTASAPPVKSIVCPSTYLKPKAKSLPAT